MKIPKVYTIKDEREAEVARITKRMLTWMPKFTIAVAGEEVITIKKEFSFFKPRYSIDAIGLEVTGDWWGMDFEVYQHGAFIGEVKKKWFTWGDSYQVKISDESEENLMIALVVAIDCVKADQSAAAASPGS